MQQNNNETIEMCRKCMEKPCAPNYLVCQDCRAKIWHITLWDKDNYVDFTDSDSSSDYFHSYSLGINHVIQWINEGKGADIIKVTFGNNEDIPKYHKRVQLIAKKCGYKAVDMSRDEFYRGIPGDRDYSEPRIWREMEYRLRKLDIANMTNQELAKAGLIS